MLDWSFRLRNEMRYADSAHFVTLTLRFTPQLGVWKRHLQLFFKRLRKASKGARIKYYAVAEYGARTMRPHYHAIIFNADPIRIANAWKLGRIHIGGVTDQSIAYVANYSLKGSRCPEGKRKPFALMSRRPAIGSKYLETHRIWHRNGQIDSTGICVEFFKPFTFVNGVRGHLPRFYRDRLFSKPEREALTALSIKEMDNGFQKELQRLIDAGYTEANAYNYITERHYFNHNQLIKNLEQHETI